MERETVLIVGASGDIGQAIAKQLADLDYQLILHYHRNVRALDQLKKNIPNEQIVAEVQADLTKTSDIEQFIKRINFSIQKIVFASGIQHFGLFQETTEETMEQMLTLHVKAPWLITKHILPQMIRQRKGKIVLITSIWGTFGASYEVIYSTLKGAQNSFVKALAKEVAPSGISVNAVSPGFIETKMNDHLAEEEKEAIISDIPMNRAGTVYDIANAVCFLLDEKSSYIQGEIVHVTGGW
ncbi:MAG TPA: SDR family oxidoreductase [Bacillota bacterium]|nr:SDR family oxidoreductase [Bacillota bacterium]